MNLFFIEHSFDLASHFLVNAEHYLYVYSVHGQRCLCCNLEVESPGIQVLNGRWCLGSYPAEQPSISYVCFPDSGEYLGFYRDPLGKCVALVLNAESDRIAAVPPLNIKQNALRLDYRLPVIRLLYPIQSN